MSKVMLFNALEVEIAYNRWQIGHGHHSITDFKSWMGFNPRFPEEDSDQYRHTPWMLGEGTDAYRKMQMLLSPHWYALLKAQEARSNVKPVGTGT